MSVYIRGMEMPKYGDAFKVYLDAADNVLLVDTSDSSRFYTLVEVKAPHGRLVDADAILQEKGIKTQMVMGGDYLYHETIIQNAPTIIEAEGKDDD